MKLGFFTVFRRDPQHYVLAEIMIRSARAAMPGIEIVQFTDDVSPPVLGVDSVRRLPGGPMLGLRLAHYAQCTGDWLLVDTDVIVQRDVRHVFTDATFFDVALTNRDWPHLAKESAELGEQGMPFNTGVVFSRNAAFWARALGMWNDLPPDDRDWLSEQRVVAALEATKEFSVAVLSGTQYNYPPSIASDQPQLQALASLLHYKGQRKAAMLALGSALTPHAPRAFHVVDAIAQVDRVERAGYSVQAPHTDAEPLRVFVGYDPRQPVAFHVAAHTIAALSSRPVTITRLQLSQLPITRRGLTEFTFTRFLAPYLSGFRGQSLFVDSDFLCRADIAELFALAEGKPESVHVVMHAKAFERPSVMLFNNAACTALTPEYVQDTTHKLFDLAWAKAGVGALPATWNHLVGYDAPDPDAKLVHFTQGVPCWPETAQDEHAPEWLQVRGLLTHSVSFQELMGHSVHVSSVQARQRPLLVP